MWLKLGDEFPVQSRSLSNGAFRTHVEGLSWVMLKETGGVVDKVAIKRFAESPTYETDIGELLAAGFWSDEGDHYRIRRHMEWQIEPEVLEQRRSDTAARQRRYREKALEKSRHAAPPPAADTVDGW